MSKKARPVNASLALTSMIDFLVVVVVFLLMSFTASGEPCLNREMKTPAVLNGMEMIDAPLVMVGAGPLLVDGSPTGNTLAIEESHRVQRIDELFNALKAKREVWKQLYPNRVFPGAVVLAIDQDVSSVIVKSVFQTAALAGYPNVSFMVNRAVASK